MDGFIRSTTYPRKLRLEELDFLSEGASITVGGEDRQRSKLNACLSVILYVLLTLSVIYYVSKFLKTTDPKIQFNKSIQTSSFRYNMSETQLYFFLLVQNPEGTTRTKFLDSSYFDSPAYNNFADESYSEDSDVPAESLDPNYDPNFDPPVSDPSTNDPGSGSTLTGTDPDGFPCDPNDTATYPDCTPNRRRRRILEKREKVRNFFLDIDTLKQYYNITMEFQVIELLSLPTGETFETVSAVRQEIIPCTDADWFLESKYQKELKDNEFAYLQIVKYGICFKIDENTVIFGDYLSKRSSRLQLNMKICKPEEDGNCSPDASDIINNNAQLGVTIGTFEPSVDNEQKHDPYVNAVNTNNRVPIESLVEATTTVTIKKLEVTTDTGLFIEDTNTKVAAAVNSIQMDYSSKLNRSPIDPTSGSYELVIQDRPELLQINLVASRITETFSRSYDTVLDMFGNIGGSVDFMIILFIVFTNWLENILSARKIRQILVKELNVAPGLHNGYQTKSCFSKNKVNVSQKTAKPEIHNATENIVEELGEEALSAEKMTQAYIIQKYMFKFLAPPGLLELAPTIAVMEKMLEERDQEKQKPANNKGSSIASKTATTQVNTPTHEEEQMDLQSAYHHLTKDTSRKGANPGEELRQHFVQVIDNFCKEFGVANAKDIFKANKPSTDTFNSTVHPIADQPSFAQVMSPEIQKLNDMEEEEPNRREIQLQPTHKKMPSKIEVNDL